MTDTDDLVLGAFLEGMAFGEYNTRYVRLLAETLVLVGPELARNVRPGERLSLAYPVQVATPWSKDSPGAIVLSETRVVLAWSSMATNPRPESVAFDLSQVSSPYSFRRRPGRWSPEQTAISFSANGQQMDIFFYSIVDHRPSTFMVVGMLTGAITAQWNDEEAEETLMREESARKERRARAFLLTAAQ